MKLKNLILSLVAATTLVSAHATVVGMWSGSTRTWNSDEFSSINAAVVAAGNTILADDSLSNSIAAASVLLIGEASAAPTAGELTALNSWVAAGHTLLLMNDSNGTGISASNSILTSLGSSISLSSADAGNSATFVTGNVASDGPPYNIVGQSLSLSPGSTVSGGNTLAGNYIHWQQIGSGFVYVFGDRSDHDFFNPDNTNPNGQVFLNIIGVQPVPEPTTIGFLFMGMTILAVFSLRRRSLTA